LSLKHKHVPEMTKHTGLSRDVLFAPAVGNYRQGMLVGVPLHLAALPETPSVERIHGALVEAYEGRQRSSRSQIWKRPRPCRGWSPRA
jgi:N-acetyl-gamma-glutamyl-phosphate reductase